MLSSVDLSGLGIFIIIHGIIFLIIPFCVISGIVNFKYSNGKISILAAVVLSMYLILIGYFGWNPPWNFWDW